MNILSFIGDAYNSIHINHICPICKNETTINMGFINLCKSCDVSSGNFHLSINKYKIFLKDYDWNRISIINDDKINYLTIERNLDVNFNNVLDFIHYLNKLQTFR